MKYRSSAALLALCLVAAAPLVAATLENARAQINTKRFQEAAATLTELTETGDDQASFLLAGLYARGQGVERDRDRARELYQQASELGNAQAARILAVVWPDKRDSYRKMDDKDDALRLAAERGWHEDIDVWLEQGANIDASDESGISPLLLAASAGNTDTVARLLAAGANLQHIDIGGESALLKAIRGGSKATVERLLAAGADIDRTDNFGNSSLHFAVRYEHDALVETLLAAGARHSTENNQGLTPLSLALRHEGSMIRERLRAADATSPTIQAQNFRRSLQAIDKPVNGARLWFIAAERGSVATLQGLLNQGVDVNQRDAMGFTALMHCAKRDYGDCVSRLLAAGANSEIRDNDKLSAVLHAIKAGHLAMADSLGANSVDAQKLATVAVASGSTQVLRWAHDHGADANDMLLAAADRGVADLVIESIRLGAQPASTDASGRSALWLVAGHGALPAVEKLLAIGAPVNATDAARNSPLHQAALAGHTEVVSRLLKAGADYNGVNQHGMTPLMLASVGRHFGVIERLYLAKADFDQANSQGQTALMLAAFRNDTQTVKLLLDYGADPSEVNKNRRNALDIATRLGNADVVAALQNH